MPDEDDITGRTETKRPMADYDQMLTSIRHVSELESFVPDLLSMA